MDHILCLREHKIRWMYLVLELGSQIIFQLTLRFVQLYLTIIKCYLVKNKLITSHIIIEPFDRLVKTIEEARYSTLLEFHHFRNGLDLLLLYFLKDQCL